MLDAATSPDPGEHRAEAHRENCAVSEPEARVREAGPPPIRTLALLAIPATVIGVACALALIALEWLGDELKAGLWTALPGALGLDSGSPLYIFVMLTAIGALVGLIVWLAPGHAGPDPATTGLAEEPLPVHALPALAAVTIIAQGGGVSLGPEAPIIVINISLVAAVIKLFKLPIPFQLGVMLATAATLGALFGTPVAAALILTGIIGMAKGGGSLWDRLFLPLVAAAVAALTMDLLFKPDFTMTLPELGAPTWLDLLAAIVIAAVAVGLGLAGVWLFPVLHRAFHALAHPMPTILAGGVVLGGLGALGGPLTLFKGLEQSNQLVEAASSMTVGALILVTVVKLVALLVASAAGFRGGRIFPSVFVGVGVGVIANSVFPDIPVTLAVAAGVMGLTLVSTRDGWLALFLGVALAGDVGVLPILTLAILPAWLLVSRRPLLQILPKKAPTVAM
jgi:H+/Cl- antiporter ClcA